MTQHGAKIRARDNLIVEGVILALLNFIILYELKLKTIQINVRLTQSLSFNFTNMRSNSLRGRVERP